MQINNPCNQIYFALTFILLLSGTLTLQAQERKSSEEEIKKLISAAMDKRKGVPQRQKLVTTGYSADDSSETLYEFGPNDTFRVVSTRKANGVETKTETIRIGATRYDRQKDGSWVKIEPKPISSGGGVVSGIGSGNGTSSGTVESTKEYFFLGVEKVGNVKTNHYRTTNKVIFLSSKPVRTRHAINDYWFRDDGLLIRETRGDGFENSRQRYKSVTDYEYDVDIKIVAPMP